MTDDTTANFVQVGEPICTCNDPKYSGCNKHKYLPPLCTTCGQSLWAHASDGSGACARFTAHTAPVVGDMPERPNPEQVEAGLSQLRRIVTSAHGYYFGGGLVEFSGELRSLAIAALDAREREIAEWKSTIEAFDALGYHVRTPSDLRALTETNHELVGCYYETYRQLSSLRARLEQAELERENLAHEVAREVFDACAAEEFGAGNSPDWSVPLRAIVARAILLYASRPASLDGEGKDG